MQRYIAFLRGINLGNRRLPMTRLKKLFEELEFESVATFIASGNVLFSTKRTPVDSLESRIANHLESELQYRVDTFVRTAEEVAAVGAARVFPEDGDEGITVHVILSHKPVPADVARKLEGVRTDVDELRVIGRECHWLCRVRTSDSKLWTLPEIKALKLPTSTMRNLKSVRKLIAKHLD